MFWSRKSHPPLTLRQRVDLDLLMRRSIEVIGEQRVRNCDWVVDLAELTLDLSTPQTLLESAWSALRKRLPAIDSTPVIEIGDLDDLGFPSVYQPAQTEAHAKILLAAEVLGDPLRTTMELAYQYSTHFWSGVQPSRPLDNDPRTTHLTPICCGLGILASDASLYDQQWSQAGYSGWSISRSGYYTAAEIGYALALLSRQRRESHPTWLEQTRLDTRVTAKQTMRYMAERERSGSPTLFDASTIPSSSCDAKQLAQWLAGDTPDFALAAAHALNHKPQLSEFALEAAMRATRSKDADLACAATRLLGRAKSNPSEIHQRIEELIQGNHLPTVMAAIESADTLGLSLQSHQTRLRKLLDQLGDHSIALLGIIGRQGTRLAELEPKLCEVLADSIRQTDEELSTAVIDCLRKTTGDPQAAIQRRIQSQTLRDAAMHLATSDSR